MNRKMDSTEKAVVWLVAVAFFALFAGMCFGQAPARKAATLGERMLALGLASVNEAGETVPAPRERVVAFIAEMNDDIAFLTQRLREKTAARDWVQNEVLPRYPVPTASPTATPAPSPTPQ